MDLIYWNAWRRGLLYSKSNRCHKIRPLVVRCSQSCARILAGANQRCYVHFNGQMVASARESLLVIHDFQWESSFNNYYFVCQWNSGRLGRLGIHFLPCRKSFSCHLHSLGYFGTRISNDPSNHHRCN